MTRSNINQRNLDAQSLKALQPLAYGPDIVNESGLRDLKLQRAGWKVQVTDHLDQVLSGSRIKQLN